MCENIREAIDSALFSDGGYLPNRFTQRRVLYIMKAQSTHIVLIYTE